MNLTASLPFTLSSEEMNETFRLAQAQQTRMAGGRLQREEFCVGAYRMKGGRLVEVLIGQKGRRGLRYVGSARPAIACLRDRLFRLLRMLRVHTFCPFVGLQKEEGRGGVLPEHKVAECQWVEANVKVWVEFEGWTENGQLVNPRVIGLN